MHAREQAHARQQSQALVQTVELGRHWEQKLATWQLALGSVHALEDKYGDAGKTSPVPFSRVALPGGGDIGVAGRTSSGAELGNAGSESGCMAP